MRKTLIALWGPANCGKSATIKRVYELFRSKYRNTEIFHDDFGRRDFVVILIIHGKKVGIGSQGDPNSKLPANLKLFLKEKCNVIICATRTRGQTVDAVDALKKQYQIVWFEQERSARAKHQASNNAMARKIFRTAEAAIR